MKPRDKKNKSAAPPPPSRRKLWLFRFIALLLPVGLLVAVEILLRLAGVGFDPHFFKAQKIGGENFLVQNEEFGFRFFPRETARSPGTLRMLAEKAPGTIRIFILGESAAMGDPEPSYGPARFMETQIREKFPNQKFEVVNVAFTAINSHVILPIARECARHSGDFWIIYMGNNEMVGPFGAATVFGSQAAPLPYVRFVTAVEATRLGQLFAGLARKVHGEKPAASSWGGMQMFLNNQIAPDSPLKQSVHRNFKKNLQDILLAGTGSGAKILLNTVAVNLKDCPPFASLPGAAGGRSAEANYREGQSLLAQNRCTEAHGHLQQASDDDALPFRTDADENEAIRVAAKTFSQNGVTLLDAAEALAADTPEKMCGDETFYEHVHFNFYGAHRLGLLWAQQLEKMLPPNLSRRDGWLAPGECGQRLGLSDWNRVAVLEHMAGRLRQPPFSTQTNNLQRLEKLMTDAKTLREKMNPETTAAARADFLAQLARSPEDYFLRENFTLFLQAVGDLSAAADEWQRVHELVPHDCLPFFQRGRLLSLLGEKSVAEAQLRAAVNLRPSFTEAWIELGNVLALQNKFSEALVSYAVAQTQRPRDGLTLFRIGKVYALQGNLAKAEECYRESIQLIPGNWEVHYELGGALDAAGQFEAALTEFGAAAELNPKFSRVHFNFGVLLAKLSHLDEAQAQFEETLRLEPGYKNAENGLVKVRLLKLRMKK